MKLLALLLLASSVVASAATVSITITGTTGEIHVGEGPIFGHHSYQLIPAGMPFVLTYIFDDEKGKQTVAETANGLITQSQIENTAMSSPGTSATLQIGTDVWEFGASKSSQIVFKNAEAGRSAEISFNSVAGGNRVSAKIVPSKNSYWPKNGDWRSSFTTESLDGSTATFAEDNDRVSAHGALIPTSITVSGVDIDGQWLRVTPDRKWQLGHPSRNGGYIVEKVSRTVSAAPTAGTAFVPSTEVYWQAWQVPAGADAPSDAAADFSDTALHGRTGDESIMAFARFYEGLTLPPSFAPGNSPYAGDRPSSTVDPHLPAQQATLPVILNLKQKF